jgi:hypothetical protein
MFKNECIKFKILDHFYNVAFIKGFTKVTKHRSRQGEQSKQVFERKYLVKKRTDLWELPKIIKKIKMKCVQKAKK